MKTFLNEEMKPFKDLSDEEIGCIIREKLNEKVEYFFCGEWCGADESTINLVKIYRIKPAKQLVIPWEHLNKEIKFVAMDENKSVYGYYSEPNRTTSMWSITKVACLLNGALNIDTYGIDWETSLVERPEGV